MINSETGKVGQVGELRARVRRVGGMDSDASTVTVALSAHVHSLEDITSLRDATA